jgi:hypothetical protein
MTVSTEGQAALRISAAGQGCTDSYWEEAILNLACTQILCGFLQALLGQFLDYTITICFLSVTMPLDTIQRRLTANM